MIRRDAVLAAFAAGLTAAVILTGVCADVAWAEPSRQTTAVTYRYNPATAPEGDWPDAIAGAISIWGIPGVPAIVSGGTTDAVPSTCLWIGNRDGINTISWSDRVSADRLGQMCWAYDGSGRLVEWDIVLRPSARWDHYDVTTAIAHELGHALGLPHAPETLCPGGSLMCPDLRGVDRWRVVDDWSMAALIRIYGTRTVVGGVAR